MPSLLSSFKRQTAIVTAAAAGFMPFTAEAQNKPSPAPTAATQSAAVHNPFLPQAPTAERPYYYVRYDEKTKAANPDRSPLQVGLHIKGEPWNGDKIIIVNYVAENSRYSAMQTELLQKTLQSYAPDSKKPFLLVDVVAYDKNGKGIYHADTQVALEHNTLGEGRTHLKLDPDRDLIPPYGRISGTSFEKGRENQVVGHADFALLNLAGTPVTNDKLLDANVDHIIAMVHIIVEGYNRQLTASTAIEDAPAVATLTRN